MKNYGDFPILMKKEKFEILKDSFCQDYNSGFSKWCPQPNLYPTYFLSQILDKYSFDGDNFFCECGSSKIYYRFDMGFETGGYIYVPTRLDVSFESLLEKGSPCFVLVHLFCFFECRKSWWLQGTKQMVEVLSYEISKEYLEKNCDYSSEIKRPILWVVK